MKAKRTFKSLFWPAFIEFLFFMLMGTIDTIMLSNYDDFAVGAVGNANTLVTMFGVLIMVISSGVAILVSQHIGAKQDEEARQVIGTGLFLNFFIGITLAGGVFLLSHQLLRAVNTSPVIYADSLTYLRLMATSLIFVALSHVITGTIRSFGYAKYVTYIVMIGNVLNIIGNYILINGHFGFPRLGVFGAGISTLGVRGIMFFVYALLLFRLLKLSLSDIKYEKKSFKNILRIGVPSALETWTYTVMQVIVISIINGLGAQYTTARTYVNTLLTYVYVFSLALATANAIMTGYAVGEQAYENAYRHTIKIVFRSFIMVGTVTLLLNIFSITNFKSFYNQPRNHFHR
jgi:putative MATE family efflux protein